jgi:predicted metalloprotease with PDZ domain
LRRDQDYYFEGRLLWLEADDIRQESDGHRSLDDFCKNSWLAAHGKDCPIRARGSGANLKELADYDWEKFIQERVDFPQEKLPLGWWNDGYRLQYATKPSEFLQDAERERKFVIAASSIGLNCADDGTVFDYSGHGRRQPG